MAKETGLINEKTVASRVVDLLRAEILSKKIQPNTRITVKEVAERYGVSAMPVREAFNVLAGEKLLMMSPYKGATVLALDRNFLVQVYDLQYILETGLFEQCMQIGYSEKQKEKLRKANQELYALLNEEMTPAVVEKWTSLNRRFHFLLYAGVEGSVAYETFCKYFDLLNAIRKELQLTLERARASVEEHDKILDTINKGDYTCARSVMANHVGKSKEYFSREDV